MSAYLGLLAPLSAGLSFFLQQLFEDCTNSTCDYVRSTCDYDWTTGVVAGHQTYSRVVQRSPMTMRLQLYHGYTLRLLLGARRAPADIVDHLPSLPYHDNGEDESGGSNAPAPSRGEAKYIVIGRALVLTCIGIGLPAFGIYATVIKPGEATIFTNTVAQPEFPDVYLSGNATMYLVCISFLDGRHLIFEQLPINIDNYPSAAWEISVTAVNFNHSTIDCPQTSYAPRAICPLSWSEIQSISLSIAVPLSGAIVGFSCDSLECDTYGQIGIPLLAGSRLFAGLAWSQRRTISGAQFTHSPEIIGLQQNTSAEVNITSLTLGAVPPFDFRLLQDTADSSFLSGISTFGGFWTFVNGTFALFFGANIVYFAFGHFLHWEWFIYSSAEPCFASGTKTFPPSKRKGVCQGLKMPALSRSSETP
ncbi:hypothetical protein C8R45DRAFT_938768 [Mycena sanguinolenta]|nr:hypothetical protein C8R45DRAFT_938768 [Mycena sanguinolenta]